MKNLPMATPMITNWKKLDDADSELVDPTLYCQLIISLMYLINTRPNICFTVNTLSRLMMETRRVNWVATKHVLRYLQCMVDHGLDYVRCDGLKLFGCTDLDWAGNVSDRTGRVLSNVVSHWVRGIMASQDALWIIWSNAQTNYDLL